MLLITTSVNYQRKLTEYNQVVNEQMAAKSALDSVTDKVDDIVIAAGDKKSLSKNENYQKLVAFQDAYSVKVASLESQAKLLKTQCDSLQKALSSNDNSKSVWCFS